MLLRVIVIIPVLLLAACSTQSQSVKGKKQPNSVVQYINGNSKIVPINAIASSSNQCVDHFNFLRQVKDSKYQEFSRQYVEISNGYTFLNVNKNIMNSDAKEVFTMNLNMKLDTLCTKVNYTGFQVIQQKIKELIGV